MLKIYSFHTNRPEFIELQLRSFQNHLKEDFEFIVINNAVLANRFYYDHIKTRCRMLGIKTIDVPMDTATIESAPVSCRPIFNAKCEYEDTGRACSYSLNWAWQNVISKETEPVMIIHHDMFLMKDVRLTDYLADYELVYVPQNKCGVKEHIWEGIVLLRMNMLPEPETLNWWHGNVNGSERTDTGGHTSLYLTEHPELRIMHINPNHIEDDPSVDFHPSLFEWMQFIGDPIVLHYRIGSNWNGMSPDYHERKTAWLKRQLEAK